MKDISRIIAHRLLKKDSPQEREALTKWKNASEKNSSFANHLEEYWKHPETSNLSEQDDIARERLITRMNTIEVKKKPHSLTFYLSRVAAILFLVISISGVSIFFTKLSLGYKTAGQIKVTTELGQRSQVTLPDGSTVWLNAGTELEYLADKRSRKVRLSGEAYFEVEHSTNQPFIVETGSTTIKVLGTKFNVSAYTPELIETSLLSGKITMRLREGKQDILINPGERIEYNSQTNSYTKIKVDVSKDILWRNGILDFEKESFKSLVQNLERYYAIDITYPEDKFKDIHFTGTIDNLRIEDVIKMISLTLPIRYKIYEHQIIISYAMK